MHLACVCGFGAHWDVLLQVAGNETYKTTNKKKQKDTWKKKKKEKRKKEKRKKKQKEKQKETKRTKMRKNLCDKIDTWSKSTLTRFKKVHDQGTFNNVQFKWGNVSESQVRKMRSTLINWYEC